VLVERPGVLIPVGSLEQHGPNLALSTDGVIAEALAHRVAARYPRAILVTPVIPLGVSYQHRTFPGTISLAPDTLSRVIRDVVGSLRSHGVTRFLLVNGHGGNHATLESLCQAIEAEGEVEVAVSTWLRTASDVIARLWPKVRVHGGEAEVSVALELAPWLVKDDALSAGAEQPYPYRHTDPLAGSYVFYPYRWEEVTENGVFGDARQASAELGREVVEVTVTRLLEFLEDFFRPEAGEARP
jgi:creatinine amidohydrolase